MTTVRKLVLVIVFNLCARMVWPCQLLCLCCVCFVCACILKVCIDMLISCMHVNYACTHSFQNKYIHTYTPTLASRSGNTLKLLGETCYHFHVSNKQYLHFCNHTSHERVCTYTRSTTVCTHPACRHTSTTWCVACKHAYAFSTSAH
jgi:hypothetical protein